MAYLHSTALLLGIKDPHIKLTHGLQEESYGDVQQFRPSAQSARVCLIRCAQSPTKLRRLPFVPLWKTIS